MAKFLLLNREEEFLQTLKNVTSAKGNKIINGEDVLDLTLFDVEIEKNYRVLLQDDYGKWHEYIAREIEETHTEKGLRTKVFLESSFYETIGDFIEERRFNNSSALVALTGVLETTRWKVGRVDNLGLSSYSPYRIDAKTAIQEICKAWGGELQTKIEVVGNKVVNRYVDILSKVGNDTGKRFTWTKDIQSIKRTVLREDVITALYGFGKGEEVGEGHGRRINFSDINDGKMYVEDNVAKERFGRFNNDGTKKHIFGKVEFDESEDKAEVKTKTEAQLEVMSVPSVSYSAEVINLKTFGYEHEGYELGDTVLIIDKDFKPELRVLARIVEKETDYLDELQSDVTLGNFIPTSTSEDLKNEGYINNFRDKEGIWDRADFIDSDGRIFIDDILDQINQQANATGGYFYYIEGEGTITTDKPLDQNPTMAVQTKGGIIRIANEKLPNGEWNWRTALTGKGIVADEINTGTLKASLIQAGFNDISDGFGVIITQDGMYSVSPSGEYTLLEEGGMKFFTRDDVLNGSIESSYAGDKTGVGVFIQPNHGFSAIRNNPKGTPNATIFEVPDDVDELRMRKQFNLNGQILKMGGIGGFVYHNVNARSALVGWNGAALGVGLQRPDGSILGYETLATGGTWNAERTAASDLWIDFKARTKFFNTVDFGKNTVKNAGIYSYASGSNMFDLDGQLLLGGRWGLGLGTTDSVGAVSKKIFIQDSETQFFNNINMQGYTITNQSDIRLKKNVIDAELDAIREIERIRMIEHEWDLTNPRNKEKPEGTHFGIEAQSSPFLQLKAGDDESYLSVDLVKQINLLTLGLQQLIKKTETENKELKQELADLKALLTEKGVI